ncbi:hypothetical protein TH9_19545 [Thalassospira xiamenensis]|uniref:hypothetical protein n=1 Tax=Thalassospira xiamenensis TaxID=220697 RepID=UPI000DED92A7|nr:hypothetical protein [Thalassospira xiamenensis]RCK30232.1 hypothetical protein TH9_19545 [Thalassospira xiamenensis]
MNAINFADTGLYTVGDAASLTGVSKQRVRGWLNGYHKKDGSRSDKRLTGQLSPIDGHFALGFLDLMEVHFISHFLKRGVKWKTLALAAKYAREMFEVDHPFASKFISDGSDIYEEKTHALLVKTADESADPSLRSLVTNQFAMYEVLRPLLIDGITFDDTGYARNWRPFGNLSSVILDPHRSFGKPILDKYSVPTKTLYDAFITEQDLEAVAEIYEIDIEDVTKAVEFEMRLAG